VQRPWTSHARTILGSMFSQNQSYPLHPLST
jgi:hypothetical protein